MAKSQPEYELRRVRRRRGRRALANFENLPLTTQVYELSAAERACPGCGQERKEMGAEESGQIEYVPGRFQRIRHLRKKYACTQCEAAGETPQIRLAARADSPLERGLAGPGLLAYIVTSKFADYLPLYRLEEIFARQGFEISRATQSVWCGDVADLAEPLYRRMAERVRQSHVVATDDTVLPMLSAGKTQPARMWVYVGDAAHPYNVFDFTLRRSRDGPQQFLKDYTQVLLADAYGGYNGVVAGNRLTRAGCLVACPQELHRGREHRAGDRPPGRRPAAPTVRAGAAGQGVFRRGASRLAPSAIGATAGRTALPTAGVERATATQASHGRGGELYARPVDRAECLLFRWRGAHR